MSESRKLATILALDIVGYSRAAERDDSAAADRVRTTRAQLAQMATARGGRIFNTAGDGFMLEFPTATAGLETALEILKTLSTSEASRTVRIGLHTGEVIIEDSGDLLGHTVNIAARLQQRADPGQIILSEDVKRSARGALTWDVVSLGEVRLDKMSETMDIYAAGARSRALRLPRIGRRRQFVAASAALLALAVITAIALLQPSPSPRIAVSAMSTPPGDTALAGLAQSINSEIVDTLSQIGLVTVDESGGRASLALHGDFVREQSTVRASVRISELSGRTLWAQTFEGPSDRAARLRLQVASVVVGVLECAIEARAEAGRLPVPAVPLALRTCELLLSAGEPQETLRAAEQVARAAPRSSLAQGRLAIAAMWAAIASEPPAQQQFYQQAEAAADAALRLDPRNGDALTAKIEVLSLRLSRAEMERTVREFLQRAPLSAELNLWYGFFLRDVGRTGDSVAYQRRALARKPLSVSNASMLAWTLATMGRDREALEMLARANARWPDNPEIWWERFRTSLWFGSPSDALQLLDEAPPGFATAELRCWERVAVGMEASDTDGRRQAAMAARECLVGRDEIAALQVFSWAGDTETAYELANRLANPGDDVLFGGPLFYPATDPIRQDARFMELMHREGLVDYWLETNQWPDFCEDPDLPYDCREEALRISDRMQRR